MRHLPELRNQIEPLPAGRGIARVIQVDQNQIELLALRFRDHGVGGTRHRRLKALVFQKELQRQQDFILVVGDQDLGHSL